MSAAPLQEFRAQSYSKVVSVPTRYDGKSNQRVIRWKDILLCFKDAQYITSGESVVLFLAGDDLEDLIPLRIAHHPGVVLKVVATNDSLHDASPTSAPSNDDHQGGGNMVDGSSSNEIMSVSRDVAALRIGGTNDSHALILRSQHSPSEMAVQQVPDSNASHFRLRTEGINTLQEQLYQLQQQMQQMHERMEEILGEIQQTNQQTKDTQQQVQQLQNAQQQMTDEIETARGTLQQQLNQQTQSSVQQLAQHLKETQQREEVLQTSQQKLQQQFKEVQEKMQQSDLHRQQREEVVQTSQQQLQQQLKEVQEKMQQSDLHRQQREEVVQTSQQQLQQQLKEVQEKMQQSDLHRQQREEVVRQQLKDVGEKVQQSDREKAQDNLSLLQQRLSQMHKDREIRQLQQGEETPQCKQQ